MSRRYYDNPNDYRDNYRDNHKYSRGRSRSRIDREPYRARMSPARERSRYINGDRRRIDYDHNRDSYRSYDYRNDEYNNSRVKHTSSYSRSNSRRDDRRSSNNWSSNRYHDSRNYNSRKYARDRYARDRYDRDYGRDNYENHTRRKPEYNKYKEYETETTSRRNETHSSTRRASPSNDRKCNSKNNKRDSLSNKSYSASSDESSDDSDEENIDDTTFHFRGTKGDRIGSHYDVIEDAGTGTFGRVIRCWDNQNKIFVCIKVIRAIEKYTKSAKVEIDILRYINKQNNVKNDGIFVDSLCVRMLDSFYHEGHSCIVFEPLGSSLYDIIKNNNYIGFPYNNVVLFAKQLCTSLSFLHSIKLIHTDLKLENVLACEGPMETLSVDSICQIPDAVDDTRTITIPQTPAIKVIDFGGATFDHEHKSREINTRQYRCPEVILGLDWSFPSDMFGLGCMLMEIYSGELLFGTHDALEHLALMEKIIGKFPRRLVKQINASHKTAKYFTKNCEVYFKDLSDESRKYVFRQLPLNDMIHRDHSDFYDFVRRCLILDPRERMTAEEALKHPLFSR